MAYRYSLNLAGGARPASAQINDMVRAAVAACERFYPGVPARRLGRRDAGEGAWHRHDRGLRSRLTRPPFRPRGRKGAMNLSPIPRRTGAAGRRRGPSRRRRRRRARPVCRRARGASMTVRVRYIVDDVDAAVDVLHRIARLRGRHAPGTGIRSAFPRRPATAAEPARRGRRGPGHADGTLPAPGGWNRIQIEVDDLAAHVERLRASGGRFRNEIVAGDGRQADAARGPVRQPVELFEPPGAEGRSRPGNGEAMELDDRGRGLVLLGCGKMGSALLEGWLARGLPPAAFTVLEPNPRRGCRRWPREGLRLNADLPDGPGGRACSRSSRR